MTICDPALPQEDALAEGTEAVAPVEKLDLPEGVPPLRAFYLYLTAGCNLACRHCWIVPRYVDGAPDPGEVIDVDALRAAVAEARPLGLANCKLTGGEPTLHPRFREIVDFLSGEGLGLDMETNGTLLTAELARHLKDESNVGFISVSLDAPTAAEHDAFRGVPGAYDGALRGLGHLVEAGYENVQLIMSVWRGNRDQVEAVVRLAEERGAASVKLNPVTATGRGVALHERGDGLGLDETLALARHVDEEVRPGAKVGVVLNLPPALVPVVGAVAYPRRASATAACTASSASSAAATSPSAASGARSPSSPTVASGATASARSGSRTRPSCSCGSSWPIEKGIRASAPTASTAQAAGPAAWPTTSSTAGGWSGRTRSARRPPVVGRSR